MPFNDEERTRSPILAAKRSQYLADIDGFAKELEALQRSHKRDRDTIRSLRSQLTKAQRSNETLSIETKSLSRENKELRSTLSSLRRSSRMRVGTAVTAPVRALARLKSPAKEPLRAQAPAVAPSGTPTFQPMNPVDRANVLRAMVKDLPSKGNVHNLIAHLYFVLGAITEPAALIERHNDVLLDLTTKEQQLVDAVLGLHRLSKRAPTLSPVQSNPGYQPERGRLMYCAHSVSPYNSNGYSTRTAGIVQGLTNAGADIVIAARPGYPWDVKTDNAPTSSHSYTETIAGLPHFFSHGPSWTQSPLDHYLQEASDSYVQVAIRNRVQRVQAASNYVTALPALVAARRLGLHFTYEVRGLWEITESSTKTGWDLSERFAFSRAMETLVASHADAVFAITPQVRDELIKRGIPSEKITILPNAVDTDEFSDMPQHVPTRTRLGLEDGVPVLGYAGSLVAYEGLSTLIDAFKLLILKDIPARMVIVGDGEALPGLKAYAAKLDLNDHIIFTGRVPAKDIPSIISVFDIMPCPRLALPVTEMVAPLKPLEAMASAKALVLSDLAPLRDLAGEDGERARLFPAGDAGVLAKVLEDLIEDPAARRAMGRRARLWTVGERNWNKVGAAAWNVKTTFTPTSSGPALDLSSLTLGIIADEFTTEGLRPEIGLVELHPGRWKSELAGSSIDALFVESAWDGNGGTWRGKVGYYDDDSFADLLGLIEHCRTLSIPTIFWNKEDPVHFNRFQQTAKHFDHVFTSDDNSIRGYLQSGGPFQKSVASLPFYAQPRLHNPLPSARAYSHTVTYAGSYYGDRYKKRSDQLHELLAAALPSGLTVYDRQHLNPDSPYKFPADLAPYVSGGLTYAEMIEAYKAHPVHINVNSVEQSGTMFSRRVFEVAACGGAIISGPGKGIERVFGSIIPVVSDRSSAEALISYWMEDEGARNDDAWLGMRSVFRSHTAAHRLAYVLRTAGLQVLAPVLEKYALRIDEATPEIVAMLEAQSVRPEVLLTTAEYESTGFICTIDVKPANSTDVDLLRESGVTLIGDVTAKPIDRTYYEDLITSRMYTAWDSARIDSDHIDKRGTELAQVQPTQLAGTPDLRLLGSNGIGDSLVLNRKVVRPTFPVDSSPVAVRKRILVAGHDLKFAGGLISHLEAAGHSLEIDQWQGHSQHDEESSRTKLADADIIFCEWTLGNAVWFSQNKRADQRLVCRLHLQELHTPYLRQLNVDKVDRFIFVGQHIASVAQRDFDIPVSKSVVIPNYVDTQRFSHDKLPGARWNIGMVGMVPQRKRLDLALDVLCGLRNVDQRYHLFVKGKRPEDFPWMADRPDELNYYLDLYKRIDEEPLLSGAVSFDEHGNDMAEWYGKIGTVLSVSDFESFHLTLADGAASGSFPVSLPWPGVDQIYPVSWIEPDPQEMIKRILAMTGEPAAWTHAASSAQRFANENFSNDKVMKRLYEEVLGHRDVP